MFTQIKRVVIKDIPGFDHMSMQFKFKQNKQSNNTNTLTTLIFAKRDKIFEFNYETEVVKDIVNFEFPLQGQPQYFV